MFKPLRVLPVLVVLAAVLMLAKGAGLGVAIEAALDAAAEPASLARSPLDGAAGGAGDAVVGIELPPSPEDMVEAAAGSLGAVLQTAAGPPAGGPEAITEPAAAGTGDEAETGAETDAMADPAEADGAEPAVSPEVRDPFDISDEELELLQRLVERREELERRAENLDEREALLAATEARISDKMNELKALQGLIESLLMQHDEQEEARMQSLVKIYESMKPKDAARIFEELDMVVLLDVIARMKERKSAPILAKMDPARAKTVTIELAQRRELPVARQ